MNRVVHSHGLVSLSQEGKFSTAEWVSIQNAVTRLFQLRRYPELAVELPQLNENLNKLLLSEVVGQFISEIYQDHILKKCMIILRQEIIEESGSVLLEKLAKIWTQFYTSILPTLQAIFAPVQVKGLSGLSLKALTLISFRDVVLLKTSITEAIAASSSTPVPPEIKQMFLVLQSVHKTPPSEQYHALQGLVAQVVQPYLCMHVTSGVHPGKGSSSSSGNSNQQQSAQEDVRASRAETMADVLQDSPGKQRKVSVTRRHSVGNMDKELNSSSSNSNS